MRSCFVLLFASLLTSCEAQGTIETPVFVLKGRDLLLKLHADPPEGVSFVEWKINKTVNLVRFDPSGKATATGRLELGRNKFSLILKNLQEADSGVYSAELVTNQRITIAEYKVTVQGPVSPVKLTMDRVESSSSESCDLHVTCRTHNSHINSTFRCVDRVCIQEGGERSEVTTSGASLQVYLLNTVIICNHSNQVNWTQDFNTTEHFCSSKPDPPLHYGWVIVICILIVIIVVLFFWLYRNRRIFRLGKAFDGLLRGGVKITTSAPPQNGRPADASGSTQRDDSSTEGAAPDKNVTNISVEPHPESKSRDTTAQTVVHPLLSSDKHETRQCNIEEDGE